MKRINLILMISLLTFGGFFNISRANANSDVLVYEDGQKQIGSSAKSVILLIRKLR